MWDSGKCDTDHSLYVVGGISVNMSNALVITVHKKKKKKSECQKDTSKKLSKLAVKPVIE